MILKINFKVASSHSKTLAVSRAFLARSRQSQVPRRQQSNPLDPIGRRSVRVLVIGGAGSLRRALVGDMIAELARGNGWSGIVFLYGTIRDSVAIGNLQIGFKALSTNPRRSTKTESGFQNIPIQFGNISFTPNHWIYCDYDGIAVSPINLLA